MSDFLHSSFVVLRKTTFILPDIFLSMYDARRNLSLSKTWSTDHSSLLSKLFISFGIPLRSFRIVATLRSNRILATMVIFFSNAYLATITNVKYRSTDMLDLSLEIVMI